MINKENERVGLNGLAALSYYVGLEQQSDGRGHPQPVGLNWTNQAVTVDLYIWGRARQRRNQTQEEPGTQDCRKM